MVKFKKFDANLVRVDIDVNNIFLNPYCKHGPSVLFTRHLCNGDTSKYYACSACRDRKLCSFYLDEENKNTLREEENYTFKEDKLFDSHDKKYKRYMKNRKKSISFCNTCSCLVLKDELPKHSTCDLIKSLSQKQLLFPSQFLAPKTNSKFEAQYFFTAQSLDVIVKAVEGLGAEKALCVGAPRVHELIRSRRDLNIQSILLDVDDRFCSFLSPAEYAVYNLFNHYFFHGSKSKEVYTQFLKGSQKLALITDPPFGGRMELIANTLGSIEADWRRVNGLPPDAVLPLVFIFPYFLEKSVKSHLPSLSMLEYQVDYDNHPLYTTGSKGLKRGSVVRMYTNLSPRLFPFPSEEGYTLCEPCGRWVHPRNVHCLKCGDCTSKDGRTYRHCDQCQFCVKPAWLHCPTCSRCLPRDHRCRAANPGGTGGQNEDESSLERSDSAGKRKRLKMRDTAKKKKKKKTTPLPDSIQEEKKRDALILQQMFGPK